MEILQRQNTKEANNSPSSISDNYSLVEDSNTEENNNCIKKSSLIFISNDECIPYYLTNMKSCQFIKANGQKCKARPLKGESHCFFHSNTPANINKRQQSCSVVD